MRTRLYAASAAVLLVAWLPKLVPNAYSVDDYVLLHGEPIEQSLRMYLMQGRFGMALLHWLLSALGASPGPRSGAMTLRASKRILRLAVPTAKSSAVASMNSPARTGARNSTDS